MYNFRFPGAVLEVGRPAAVRAIVRARRMTTPPVPLRLSEWPAILNSPERGPRLENCNGEKIDSFKGLWKS